METYGIGLEALSYSLGVLAVCFFILWRLSASGKEDDVS